ncbi:MAG: GAF domain-containing protein [Limnospira sp.]
MKDRDINGSTSDIEIAEYFFDFATSFAVNIRQIVGEIDSLNFAVDKTRNILNCSRAIAYQFLPDGDGVVIAESVETRFQPILGQLIYDPCFEDKMIEPYRQGRVSAIADIYQSQLQPCHIKLLESFQVRANLVVPILIGKQPEVNLWGLLIAHQCDVDREWHPLEIKLLQNIAAQIGISLQKSAEIKARQKEELRRKEALFRAVMNSSILGFYVVDNRTDNILYFNRQFCKIWAIKHLEAGMKSGELKNNDIIPDCIPLIADCSIQTVIFSPAIKARKSSSD